MPVRQAGIDCFTVGRCPRCPAFTTLASDSIRTAADVVAVWAITKATEQVRTDLYFEYASQSARSGELERARDVALETVGHVSLEEPRLHLLLGQIAVALGDRELLQEAKAFLRFFRLVPWEMKLYEVESSRSPDFGGPE